MNRPKSSPFFDLTDPLRTAHMAYGLVAVDGLSLMARLLLVHGIDTRRKECVLNICCFSETTWQMSTGENQVIRSNESNGFDCDLWDALNVLQERDYFEGVDVDPLIFRVTTKGKLERRRIVRALRQASEGITAADLLRSCESTLSLYRMPGDDAGELA